jgi:poly-gamma-glutamate synthesis protein (capsule biosynthesis protein)
MYFASVDPSKGKLVQLEMTPTRIKHFKVSRASRDEAVWLGNILNREGKKFGTRVNWSKDNLLTLLWGQSPRNHAIVSKKGHS